MRPFRSSHRAASIDSLPSDSRQSPRARCGVLAALIAACVLAACSDTPSKEEEEAAKRTFTCQQDGERIVIRFEVDEARLLTASGERIILYQIPAASGVRYSNGELELRGKGTELQLVKHGNAAKLTDCQPLVTPK
jgi:membrane-bound inhibitor of C-type lysozyme